LIATAGSIPFHVGASYLTGTAGAMSAHEGMVGALNKMRVYPTYQDTATIAAYSAQLT